MGLFRSLLFWLVVTSGIAFVWPSKQLEFDPFILNSSMLWALIVITMLALGLLAVSSPALWVFCAIALQRLLALAVSSADDHLPAYRGCAPQAVPGARG